MVGIASFKEPMADLLIDTIHACHWVMRIWVCGKKYTARRLSESGTSRNFSISPARRGVTCALTHLSIRYMHSACHRALAVARGRAHAHTYIIVCIYTQPWTIIMAKPFYYCWEALSALRPGPWRIPSKRLEDHIFSSMYQCRPCTAICKIIETFSTVSTIFW